MAEEEKAWQDRQNSQSRQMDKMSLKVKTWLSRVHEAFAQHLRLQHELDQVMKSSKEPVPITSDILNSVPMSETSLTLKSGVVIKAGAEFRLPVICSSIGAMVEWQFQVEEVESNIDFELVFTPLNHPSSKSQVLVILERMERNHGRFSVDVPGTLNFRWDNGFSWINAKTLDYHVNVLTPLDEASRMLRMQEHQRQSAMSTLERQEKLLTEEDSILKQLETHVNDGKSLVAELKQCLEEWAAHREVCLCCSILNKS
jgi:hypothetical protein